ncbi:MAG: hypothetical protein R3B91_16370 [Planctomycetaceae bacterium]
MRPASMRHYVQATLMGEYDISEFVHEVSPRLQTPEEHGRCPLCADAQAPPLHPLMQGVFLNSAVMILSIVIVKSTGHRGST